MSATSVYNLRTIKLFDIQSSLDYELQEKLHFIGFTQLYLKMDVMPLVHETKMADLSLGNLLARRTTWLVLKTTCAISIFSAFLEPTP